MQHASASWLRLPKAMASRVMGPNGIGVIDTHTPLNTTFVLQMPAQGEIAFVSQSGALCGGVIDWAVARGLGFSRFLSVGNEADVNETDLLAYLGADDISRVLALYLEDVKGGTGFVPALRSAAARKPVVAVKAGRTASGQAATASHTGALASAHSAFRAACRSAGVIEVDSIAGLFDAALALAYQPLPAGNRVAMLTNAGGPAALAADALEAAGLLLAHTTVETQAALRAFVPHDAQVGGPVDLLGGADQHGYRRSLELLLADEGNDGVLAILVPTALVDPVAVVEGWAGAARGTHKPVVACLMGEASLAEAQAAAQKLRIPACTFPEDAVAAFGALRQRALFVERAAQETPALPVDRAAAAGIINRVREAGRLALDTAESLALLAAYGVPVACGVLATSPEEAAAAARQEGFPVAMKLVSPDILHKTDAGGVVLRVASGEDASRAYHEIIERAHSASPDAAIHGVLVQRMVTGGHEVIVGVKRDATFGPLLMFGLGGIYVEALRDVSFRLAPLAAGDAEEMVDEVRSSRLLAGLRGAAPADRPALLEVLRRTGQLAADFPGIAELDVNPLLVLPMGQGAIAVDCRVILNEAE